MSAQRTAEGGLPPAVSLHDRAVALLNAGDHAQALAAFDEVVGQLPTLSLAWLNRGSALRGLGRFEEALSSYDRALSLAPDLQEAHFNRGLLCLMDLGDHAQAARSFARVRADGPPLTRALSFEWLARRQMGDWSRDAALLAGARDALDRGRDVVLPFAATAMFDEPALLLRAAQLHAVSGEAGPPNASVALGPVAATPRSGRRLRVGYYSADFHDHATMRLIAELFECHDRTRFEWFAFSFGPDVQDVMRVRARAAFDRFVDVRAQSDQDVARLSRQLGIDVAVDLKGYTTDSRPGIFAYRCAPVQVSYLGYPGTLGAPWMDYIVGDDVVIPEQTRRHYAEQVVYLPRCYQCNDRSRIVSPRTFTRAELGLPEHGVVYCCFNNNYKLSPATFAVWMRILREVPGSVLWLLRDNEWVDDHLRREAVAQGVTAERLVFAPRMPQPEHLARQKAADLFLDTWPYNAHTTASDALWVGLPVLTLAGESFAARVAASLLTAVGLAELVTHWHGDYEALAIALGREPRRLSKLRMRLESAVADAPLFETAGLARALEWAYLRLHERAAQGSPPDVLRVPSAELMPPAAEEWVQRGLRLHRSGDVGQARDAYARALGLQPDSVDALQLMGVCLSQLDEHEDAVRYLERAAALRPDHAVVLSNLGGALRGAGRQDEALARYDEALRIQPAQVDAWLNRGHVLFALDRPAQAYASYERAWALDPGLLPRMPVDALHNWAVALIDEGRIQDALTMLDQVTVLMPGLSLAWYNRGHALEKLGRLEDALASYEHALALSPGFAEAHNGIAYIHLAMRRPEAALAACDHALRLKPSLANALNNKGRALQELGRLHESLEAYEQATVVDPGYGPAYNNQGAVLDELDRYEEAAARFEQAFEVDPSQHLSWGHRLSCLQVMCDWRERHAHDVLLRARLEQGEKICTPFPVLSMIDSAAHHRMAAEIYARESIPTHGGLGPVWAQPVEGRRLRVGYYSADFHEHATMRLMAELFERHDRLRFEWFAFSFGPAQQDAMRARAERAFDRFLDVRGCSDLEVARLSRECGIDVAVDLKGYTKDCRPGIFAHRCAPVQVSYLGYPGTLGASWMDYIVADDIVIPRGAEQHYSEAVVRLPHTYQCNDRLREVAPREFSRSELGLPEEGFIYYCFNNNYKIAPATFDAWMRILKAVPGSVLWLLQDNAWVVKNLRREAAARGVAPERLVFASRMLQADHLARQRVAQLFLDTWPYNAHTTASDALWVGLPVLTCTGEGFASRVAASLLTAAGMQDLITHSQEQYETAAIALGRDPVRLRALAIRLGENRSAAPLFDSSRLACALEWAYMRMHERAARGQAPETFSVPDVH